MERFGLVGLPNAGKSSLYNALTGGGALAAPYPFATKDPNIGVAKVPDDRVDRLAVMSKTKTLVHASVEVVDIGGLVEGASKGEGLGNKFLANIREVDAIVFVLRAFVDDDVTGPSDPIEHLRVVEIELALADLETVEKRLNQATRQAKLDKVESLYRSRACPAGAQAFALNLYHCLSQVQDALRDLERYTMGYVDSYLRDGRELLREAKRLRSQLLAERRQLEL